MYIPGPHARQKVCVTAPTNTCEDLVVEYLAESLHFVKLIEKNLKLIYPEI